MYSCENAIEENNVQNVASTGVLVTKTNPIDEVTIDVVKKVAGMYGNAQSAQTRGGEERPSKKWFLHHIISLPIARIS